MMETTGFENPASQLHVKETACFSWWRPCFSVIQNVMESTVFFYGDHDYQLFYVAETTRYLDGNPASQLYVTETTFFFGWRTCFQVLCDGNYCFSLMETMLFSYM
jgi:hypothetical protein